jgi:hypothetical protein
MEIRVEQIEGAIRVYKDFWRMYSIQNAAAAAQNQRLFTACGAAVHHAELGNFLLGLPRTLANNGLDRFAPPHDFPDASQHGYNLYLPYVLTPWIVNGRHTYGMTADLQAVLSNASIGKMKWCDFVPPFESFSVQLANPISVPGGGSFNHILMSCREHEGKTYFNVWTFSTGLKNYRGINEETQDHIARWLRNRHFERLRSRVKSLGKHLQECVKGGLRTIHVSSHQEMIGTWLEELADPTSSANRHRFIDSDQLPAINIACRIAIGVGLHLQSGARECERRRRRRHSLTTRTVEIAPLVDTTEDRIPVLRLRSALSHREQIYFGLHRDAPDRGEILRQIYCHWVRAHQRHYPGEPPEKEKRVKVGAYMVLSDKLPEFGLPPGTFTALA